MASINRSTVDTPIFQDLPQSDWPHVQKLLEHVEYPEGEVVIREGNSVQILWIITKGRCEVFKLRKDGSEQQLANLEPGAVFGEMSFFYPAPHSASVRTLRDVEVLRLTRSDYERLQVECPTAANHIARYIVAVLAERLRRMDEWTCELVEKPEAERHREEWREFRSKLYSYWQF